jgi:hypothetical protein
MDVDNSSRAIHLFHQAVPLLRVSPPREEKRREEKRREEKRREEKRREGKGLVVNEHPMEREGSFERTNTSQRKKQTSIAYNCMISS